MTFWKLYTLQIACLALLGFAWQFGYVDYVLANDVTRLSVVIAAVFIAASAYVGVIAAKGKQSTNALWFASDAVLSLGMMGTVLGLLIVLTSNFGSVDTADAAAMSALMAAIGSGMGTALTTTIVGLGASVLLKLELVILEG